MATHTSNFNSPFIYTTFASSDNTSIHAVYKQRIIDLYQQQYPSIKKLSTKDINVIITNNKVTQFKLQQQKQQQQQEIADAKKQKEPNKLIPDDDKKNDAPIPAPDPKDNTDQNKVHKPDEQQIEATLTEQQKKLLKALDLLENEYFGNEHALYTFLCSKYKQTQSNILTEYVGQTGNTISDKRMEQSDKIMCCECEEKKDFTQFDVVELCNGYFAACKECAPDRDSVKNIKWHVEWRAPSITLKDKNYVAYKSRSCHEGATSDLKPSIKNGQHCFRWLFKTHQGWGLFGIAAPKKGQNNLYADRGVYGIANGGGCYKDGRHHGGIDCHHLYQNADKKLIDMSVDLNKGEMCYMEVDDAEKRVTKLTGIPKSDDGYNPCISLYYTGHSVQIKKIPLSWFGKHAKRTKFKY